MTKTTKTRCKWAESNELFLPYHDKEWGMASQRNKAITISEVMSKQLKKRGFRFVGPTICYAFMQAVGIINDHSPECFRSNRKR